MTTITDYYRILKSRGFKRVIDQALEINLFDWLRGTDTGTWVPISDYSESEKKAGAHHYDAVYTGITKRIFRGFLEREGKEALNRKIIDLGCGKGKILLIAGEFGFTNLNGVEIREDLVEIAQSNLAKRRLEAKIFAGDVRKYSGIEPGSIIFAYNPFECELMKKIQTIASQSEGTTFIYINPTCKDQFSGWDHITKISDNDAHRNVIIYSNDPVK